MTLVDRLLPRLNRARTRLDTYGLRPSGLTITVRTWASGKVGDGAYSDSSLAITPAPKMREMSDRDVASSGGRYNQGDLEVSHITPAFTGPPAGGYTPAQLLPPIPPGSRGVELIYTVTGPEAGQYRHISSDLDRPMRYGLVIRRLTGQRP